MLRQQENEAASIQLTFFGFRCLSSTDFIKNKA